MLFSSPSTLQVIEDKSDKRENVSSTSFSLRQVIIITSFVCTYTTLWFRSKKHLLAWKKKNLRPTTRDNILVSIKVVHSGLSETRIWHRHLQCTKKVQGTLVLELNNTPRKTSCDYFWLILKLWCERLQSEQQFLFHHFWTVSAKVFHNALLMLCCDYIYAVYGCDTLLP